MVKWLRTGYLDSLKAIKGWKRMAIHEVADALVIGAGRQPHTNVAKYLVVNGKYLSCLRQ